MSNDQRPATSNGDALGFAWSVCHIHATALAVFMRRDFGREALGMNAFFAMLLILGFYSVTADRAVFVFFGCWLVAQITQRVLTFRLVRSGAIFHSRYAGYPWLAMKVPFVRESAARGLIEPMLCLVAGALLCPVSENLGGFVMLGFLTFLIRNAIEMEIVRKRVEQMHDAEIEQRYLASRFRNPMED